MVLAAAPAQADRDRVYIVSSADVEDGLIAVIGEGALGHGYRTADRKAGEANIEASCPDARIIGGAGFAIALRVSATGSDREPGEVTRIIGPDRPGITDLPGLVGAAG